MEELLMAEKIAVVLKWGFDDTVEYAGR